jgi:hypothetical protein
MRRDTFIAERDQSFDGGRLPVLLRNCVGTSNEGGALSCSRPRQAGRLRLREA